MNEIQSTKSLSKLKKALRWLAVLPAAIGGFLLGHIIIELLLNFFMYIYNRIPYDDVEYFLLYVVSPIISTIIAIIFGYQVAPKWKNIVGFIIGVLIFVCCIWLIYRNFHLIYFLNVAFTAVFSVMILLDIEPIPERYKKLENTLRWLAVLPASIGVFYFVLLLFSMILGNFFIFVGPAISSIYAVVIGFHVAPSGKKVVAFIIAGLIIVLCKLFIYRIFVTLPSDIYKVSSIDTTLELVFAAIGAGLALWGLWKNN